MKKILSKIIPLTLTLLVAGVAFVPHAAHATFVGAVASNIIGGIAGDSLTSAIAWIANLILTFTATLLTASGIMLSIAMNLTTHIQTLLDQVTGIQAVWLTIRDISSIFIIFALLYFSIRTILGSSTSGLNQLIVKIFLAGLFINFSLFFVKVGVDASNLVSLQFYNAISPGTDQNLSISSAYTQGGLSNVFMQNLKIPTVYQNNATLADKANTTSQIFFATLGGIIIMFTAALSFFGAAIAFTARTGILLFVMAVSPIYFVGLIFPKVKHEISDKIMDVFTSQLVFMPVYLFFMYIALKIISDPHFMAIFNPTTATANTAFPYVWSGIIIQYVIAIFFINLPLVVALKLGGSSTKWAMGWVPDAGKIGKTLGGFAGRNTIGRAARGLGKSVDNMAASDRYQSGVGKFAASIVTNTGVARHVRTGIKDIEASKFGGKESLADVEKYDKERTKTIAGVQRTTAQKAALSAVIGKEASEEQLKKFYDTVGGLDKKEVEGLSNDTILSVDFAATLSSKQAEALLDGDKLTEDQKNKFKDLRKQGLGALFLTQDKKTIAKHMKGLSGKELSKMDPKLFARNEFMDNLNPAHLKEMEDTLDREAKRKIANYIHDLPADNDNKAYGYFRDNRNFERWTA